MTLAVSITCASPTSPGRSESRIAQFDQLEQFPVSAVAGITSITVALAQPTLDAGQTTVATATLLSSAGRVKYNRKPKWSSSDVAVAVVDSITGSVRALALGTALIIASVGDVSGHAALGVTSPEPPPPPPPPVATQLAITAPPPATALSGVVFSPPPAVSLRDASNAPVSQAGVTVSVAIASGGGTLNGTPAVTTDASGVATFSDLSITGSAGDRSLVFSAPSLASATSSAVTITEPAPPPPPPSGAPRVLFHSDWSTATGVSKNALMDMGKPLPWMLCCGDGLEVIPSTGLGFPTPNVLRVTVTEAKVGFAFLRKTGLPIPAVSESRYYRWYTRIAMSDGLAVTDPETHPHQDGSAFSVSNWLFHVYHDAGPGRWLPQFRPNTATNVYPGIRWSGPALLKNVTYRFEVQIHRTGTNTFQMHVRVYDTAGALIHTDADFRNEVGAALATNPTFNFTNVANMDGLNAGLNGLSGSDWFPSAVYMYQGGVAVCADGWCGPYSP